MNNYLERNSYLVEEINNEIKHGLLFDKSWNARSLSGTDYYTVGSYDSPTLDRELFLGFKKYKNKDPEIKVVFDLAIIRSILNTAPELEDEIPTLNALLSHETEGAMGYLVEDVSCGGELR